MSVAYTCPNPDCRVVLKTPSRVAVGKSVKCPKCSNTFVPEPGNGSPQKVPATEGGTLKFADDGPVKRPTASKSAPPKAEPPPTNPDDDDESAESVRKGYGVMKETAAELEAAEKNKVKFGEVEDKIKKSSRGPAIALLVMPSNLLTAVGLLTAVFGVGLFVWGMWPMVFNDAPPGDEEIDDAIFTMFLATLLFGWGVLLCFGASQMQELASYMWAMVGAVMAIPLLVGIFAVIILQDPKVKAGFEESEGGPGEGYDEEDKKEDDEDDDDEDEDDDDDDEDRPKKRAKGKR